MDFTIPSDIQALLDECDTFIDDVIKPIEAEDDNIRFFDHRREDSRTDWDRDGLPNAEWEALLGRMRREADAAGLLRYQLPARFGGRDGSNLPFSTALMELRETPTRSASCAWVQPLSALNRRMRLFIDACPSTSRPRQQLYRTQPPHR